MKRPELSPNDRILHLLTRRCQAVSCPTFINAKEHPFCPPHFAPNDLWLFPKVKSSLKGRKFQNIKTSKKCDGGTESWSTTGVPKIFPNVAASLD
jgi:hypothetical protein